MAHADMHHSTFTATLRLAERPLRANGDVEDQGIVSVLRSAPLRSGLGAQDGGLKGKKRNARTARARASEGGDEEESASCFSRFLDHPGGRSPHLSTSEHSSSASSGVLESPSVPLPRSCICPFRSVATTWESLFGHLKELNPNIMTYTLPPSF